MALKFEGDKITKVGGGGGDTLGYLLKMFFGNDPSQWVRFVLLGVAITYAFFTMKEFKHEVIGESREARRALTEYIAANEKWQELTAQERIALIRKVDARFRRLYIHNGWEYQGLTE